MIAIDLTPRFVFLLDLVGSPEVRFPVSLQRPRYQAVLGFDGIVLAPGTLGVVAPAHA